MITVIYLCKVTHLSCVVIRIASWSEMQWDTLKRAAFGRECTVDVDLGSRVGNLASVSA